MLRQTVWWILLLCLGWQAVLCEDTAEPRASLLSHAAGEAHTLMESRLLNLLERQRSLLAKWAATRNEDEKSALTGQALNLVHDYESIILANPEEILPLLLYGKFLRQIDEPERAHQIFLKANALDPKVAVVKQQLANYFAEIGDHRGALIFFLAATELEPKVAVYHFSLGQCLAVFTDKFLQDEVYDRATLDKLTQQAFAEAVRLEPHNKDFQFRYGESFYDVEKPDWTAALAHWEKFFSLAVTDTEREIISLHKARVLCELQRWEDARESLAGVTKTSLEKAKRELWERLPTVKKSEERLPQDQVEPRFP